MLCFLSSLEGYNQRCSLNWMGKRITPCPTEVPDDFLINGIKNKVQFIYDGYLTRKLSFSADSLLISNDSAGSYMSSTCIIIESMMKVEKLSWPIIVRVDDIVIDTIEFTFVNPILPYNVRLNKIQKTPMQWSGYDINTLELSFACSGLSNQLIIDSFSFQLLDCKTLDLKVDTVLYNPIFYTEFIKYYKGKARENDILKINWIHYHFNNIANRVGSFEKKLKFTF